LTKKKLTSDSILVVNQTPFRRLFIAVMTSFHAHKSPVNPLTPTVAMGTAIEHSVPDRVPG